MTEARTLRIEDLSGRVDVYEGETVRFTLDTSDLTYRLETGTWSEDLDYWFNGAGYKDNVKFEVGDRVGLWHSSVFRSAIKYDIEGSPSSIFSLKEIDENGQAVWEYSFVDDGASEGAEVVEVLGFNFRSHEGHSGYSPDGWGFGNFDLVINDPIALDPEPEPEPTPDVVNHITNNTYNQNIDITTGDIVIENAFFLLDRLPVDIDDLIQGSRKKADFVGGTRKDDVIGFGKGRDRLMGDEGADQFVMFAKDRCNKKGADNIIDFSTAEGDQLIVSKNALKGLNKKAKLGIAESKKELKAMKVESVDLIYFEPKGHFYYDQNDDSKGFGEGGLFAVLKGAPVLDAESIGIM